MADQRLQQPPPVMAVERRVLCSHTTMERVFGSQKRLVRCQFCDEADLGWVYVCTEDRGRLALGAARKGATVETSDEPAPELNEWVLRAIEDGHYTEEQIRILQTQRSNVRDVIANQNKPPLPEQNGSPVVAAPKDDALDILISEQQRASLLTEQLKCLLGMLHADDGATGSLVTNCHLRLCHYCFPSGKDRTWLSLDKVCSEQPASVQSSPANIFEIPRAEIPLFPIRRAKSERDTPATQPESYPNTGSTIDNADTNNNTNADVASGAVDGIPQSDHLLDATIYDSPPADLSTREALHAAFQDYKRQRLGTPRKIHRRRHHLSLDNADEYIAPARERPKLARRPKWTRGPLPALDEVEDGLTACVESEVIASGDTDIVTQV